MFNLTPKQNTKKELPCWVKISNERVKKIYYAIEQRISDIEALINLNKPLTPTQYKIGKSILCSKLGISGSYINKHSDLNQFVDLEQRRINRMVKEIDKGEIVKASIKNKPSQMRRDELIKEVVSLRKELDKRKDDLYISQLNYMIDSGLSEAQVITSQRIIHLEETVKRLQEMNASLENTNKMLTNDLVVQLEVNSKIKSDIEIKNFDIIKIK